MTGGVITDDPFVVISTTNATDIAITHDGDTHLSTPNDLNTLTHFGILHFIGPNEETKILALTADHVYDVLINGTDFGTTDYTIRFYDDLLEF